MGSIRACVAGERPPEVAARLLPGQERFGYRLHRTEAFGFDSYAASGHDPCPLATGGTASLADLARTSVDLACDHLEANQYDERDALLQAALAGPLAPRRQDRLERPGRTLARSVFGDVIDCVQRPGFRLRPELATWGHTVFRAERGARSAAICVEAATLGTFLSELQSGALDSVIEAALDAGSSAPALGAPGQPVRPGIYGSVADPMVLVPEEIPTMAGRRGKKRPGRIGKVVLWPAMPQETAPARPPLPAGPGKAPPKTHLPWWAVAAATVTGVAILAGAVAWLAGGGGEDSGDVSGTPSSASPEGAGPATTAGGAGSSETPAATETQQSPAATATSTPTPLAEPTQPVTPTATSTLSPTPTPTPTPVVEPSPTATATPTRIVEPTPTPTPDGGLTPLPTLPPAGETAPPASTPCPPGQVCA